MATYKRSTSDERNLIISLYYTDMNAHEVARHTDRSYSFVRNLWRSAGLSNKRTHFQDKVYQLRKQGKCSVEIAEALGKPVKAVYQCATSIGLPFTDEEKRQSKLLGHIKQANTLCGGEEARIERQRQYIEENHPGWSYVSGFVASDGFMQLLHSSCGNVIEKSAVTVRHNHGLLVCPFCEEKKKEEREAERRQEELEREKRFWSQEFTQTTIAFRVCPECGTPHVKTWTKYCSRACARKVANRRADKRVRKIKNRDGGISLRKLYKRDNGKCWLCGGECDYLDFKRDAEGNFIVGSKYPSIDHVYPLSKGGAHRWDNVKLAHHYCNTLKRDKVVV